MVATRKTPTTWRHSTGTGYTILGTLTILRDTISGTLVATYAIAYVIAFSMLLLSFNFLFKYLTGQFLVDQTSSYQHFLFSLFSNEVIIVYNKKMLSPISRANKPTIKDALMHLIKY